MTSAVSAVGAARCSIRVTGVVQGVGYRPFVSALAGRFGLSGFVGNDDHGVFIEVQGREEHVAAFVGALRCEAPPLARIESVVAEPTALADGRTFSIVPSRGAGLGSAFVSPDVAMCDDCARELHDPTDRRYRYPFINCTNCGPRFTITTATPYDRPNTTMAAFALCPACAAEYGDPQDRRFHAQPVACPACGPQVSLTDAAGRALPGDPIAETRALIAAGLTVAVKGLGGYHLACDAGSDAAVARLRERKGRPDKPLAVMVADLDTARRIARIDEAEAALLSSVPSPIVLVEPRDDGGVSDLVAPRLAHLGIMLAYTPVHDLLVERGAVWVMTSGNRSSEPIVWDDADAKRRLVPLCDAFLSHDRPIHVPCDDSVIRVLDGAELPIRRSRGYAPFPVRLPLDVPPILATGGELKATACLAEGRNAFMSQHIGDMENLETLEAFSAAVTHLEALFRIRPEVFATDLHPGYLSARWTERVADGRPVVKVQHHHAHLASLLAEHSRDEDIIGVCFDGTGYGSDGTVWGGEVLVGGYREVRRAAHLVPVLLPGGDAAVQRPYRMALSHLSAAGIEWSRDLEPVRAATDHELAVVAAQLERGLASVPTSSMGRLFDAVASIAGIRQDVTYEAQAAIEMEAASVDVSGGRYGFAVAEGRIDAGPVIAAAAADATAGEPVGAIAMRFHRAVEALIVEIADRERANTGLATVGLTGGVFQNIRLVAAARRALEARGFEVMTHRVVPPNDGGLALGQAMVAAAKAR